MIAIRRILGKDLPLVAEIANHPYVSREGMRYQAADFLKKCDLATKGIAVSNRLGLMEIFIAANDDSAIGYLVFTRYADGDLKCAYVGWDFHPNTWGTGLTSLAFQKFMKDVVFTSDVDWQISCCYHDNIRCNKFMVKQGYQRIKTPLIAQISFLMGNLTLRRRATYQIDVKKAAQHADG